MDFRGRFVLVTGASSGLGTDIARYLASAHGANLVLVARRADRLEALKAEIAPKYGVEVVCIAADLTKTADVERVFEESTRDRAIHGVVLNAGVTFFGEALDQSFEAFEAMLSTNVTSVVRLVWRFVPYLQGQADGGGVMLVSSLAGFWPMPFQAAYGGTKAFLNNFGQGLAEELRGTKVSVTVFAPGGIATEMLDSSGISRKFKAGDVGIMDSPECARHAVESFRRRRPVYIPGMLNELNTFFMRFVPRTMGAGIIANMYRGALVKKAP